MFVVVGAPAAPASAVPPSASTPPVPFGAPPRGAEVPAAPPPAVMTLPAAPPLVRRQLDVPLRVPGEYVLVHVGFALTRMDEAEAEKLFALLEGLE